MASVHGNRADQKDFFMAGYDEMLRRIEPKMIIFYHYPFSECWVIEILRLTEGDIAPVACLECNAEPCQHTAECRTRPMWENLNLLINNYLDSVTIADLMKHNNDK